MVTGGPGRPDGLSTGYYVRPTVFADVNNDMTIAREEIFGPVLCILGYDDLDQAVEIGNDTDYGLFGYVSGADPERRGRWPGGSAPARSPSTMPSTSRRRSVATRPVATAGSGAKRASPTSWRPRPSWGTHRPVRGSSGYRYRTGIPWRDLPRSEFGPWQTVWKRHRRYAGDGTWDRVLSTLLAMADAEGRLDWTVSVDATINRAHQHATNTTRPDQDTGGWVGLHESAAAPMRTRRSRDRSVAGWVDHQDSHRRRRQRSSAGGGGHRRPAQ